jgi:GT2 family glycosyltransferase
MTHPFQPARVLDVDIDQPLPTLDQVDPRTGHRYRRALSLVRLHGQPLGMLECALPGEQPLSGDAYAQAIFAELGPKINAHLREDGLAEATGLSEAGLSSPRPPACVQARDRLLAEAGCPAASVVVATRDRPDTLAVALESLLAQDYANREIIVVDNAPSSRATLDLIRERYAGLDGVRYVREDTPGLSSARNRGLRIAQGEIVAFTDDDVVADCQWLTQLVSGFGRAENVACVTGAIVPIELETVAQAWIEQFGGFHKGFERRVFDNGAHKLENPLYPYAAGMFGSGANLSFRVAALRTLGGFDPALSTGTIARGGEDLAMFLKVIKNGYRLVYEPAALVHHRHRRDYAGLRKQTYGYGVGLSAYLTASVVNDPRLFLDLLPRIPSGLRYAFGPHGGKNHNKQADYPRDLDRAELLGALYGPVAYLRSRHRLRSGSRKQVTSAGHLREELA